MPPRFEFPGAAHQTDNMGAACSSDCSKVQPYATLSGADEVNDERKAYEAAQKAANRKKVCNFKIARSLRDSNARLFTNLGANVLIAKCVLSTCLLSRLSSPSG